jgi:sterol desaturase/sphingolipid hydroxylase (fatty acid hydroxylase superfamily)
VVDLTVAAIPFYFGSMEAERRWLRRRAEQLGPSPADYTREDALASLAMGVGSLIAPFVTHKVARKVALGEGRYGKALLGLTGAAVVATTVADRIVRRENETDDSPDGDVDAGVVDTATEGNRARRRRAARVARMVARAGGVTAVAAGTVLAGATALSRGSARKMWDRSSRDLGDGPLAWAAAIAGWDLIYYWNHRFMHEVRGMWAIHVVHHSSEHYNLSTALRQPVADALGVFVPYGLLSRMGVRPHLVEQARGVNLIYQYWIHTDAIRRIGPGEAMLNTPSHHRVHHGANTKYIDRNHGSILIIWDRLFGTFQREEEPVVYGLTKNINTYNPTRIASHEYRDIIRDVADSTTWRDRLSFVLRGPGWAYARHAERERATSIPTVARASTAA